MTYEFALPKGSILRHSSMLGKESIYKIEKVLGQGGFGITYLASMTIKIGHTPHKILFAIKEFFVKGQCWRESSNPQMRYSPAAKMEIDECKKDFIDEANRLNRICSENINIVNVNEVFEANDTAYYVMEYLNGDSLRDKILKKNGTLSETDALSMIIPIAESVEQLHDQYKLLHCDISPDNIMLRDNGDGVFTPVLIDFGESLHFNSRGELTTTHNTIGAKVGYAPQEQYRGVTSFDSRIDVYALGATLFYLLTGKNPISAFDISKEYIDKNLPNNISDNIRQAIFHAMAKDKEERTPTVKQFVTALKSSEGFPQQDPPNHDYLPEGYCLHGTDCKAYLIVALLERSSFYLRYKAERVSVGTSRLSNGATRRAVCDVYEFFDQKNHQRQENHSLIPIGDLSSSQHQYVSFFQVKIGKSISIESWKGDGLRWDAFKSNNTLYVVDSHRREPLPWKKILTYAGVGIAGALLIIGAINLYKTDTEGNDEMSQRLTEAIATNNAAVLQEFAVEHDSTRAYVPYAKLCLENNDFDTAEKYANDSLMPILQQKKDSLALVTQRIANEQIFDSLYNAAKSQFDSTQYRAAQLTLAKMDSEYLSRQKVKDLSLAIEKAITPTDDETYQQALKEGNWSVIENLANKGYSKAYYKLAKRYYDLGKFSLAKQWATKSVKARLSVTESNNIINKVNEKEYFSLGNELYYKWVNTGDSLTRDSAIQTLQKANQNDQVVKNMLKVLNKERKSNSILH